MAFDIFCPFSLSCDEMFIYKQDAVKWALEDWNKMDDGKNQQQQHRSSRSTYKSKQTQQGPAPFASFEDLSLASFELSPEEDNTPLPGMRIYDCSQKYNHY